MKKLLSVFLIAIFLVSSFAVLSAAEEAHTHEFGEWRPHDEVTLHHYRECPCGGEGAVEIEPCVWDEGELFEDYGILYRCTVCGSTTMEPLEEEGIVNGPHDVLVTVAEGSSASLPEGAELKVKRPDVKTLSRKTVRAIKDSVEGRATVLALYDFTLMNDGVAIQPGGVVNVRLLVPKDVEFESLEVYYITDAGGFEKCPTTVNAQKGTYTFQTDHFSTFAVVGITEDKMPVGAIIGIAAGGVVLVAAAVAGVLLAAKKKKAAKEASTEEKLAEEKGE